MIECYYRLKAFVPSIFNLLEENESVMIILNKEKFAGAGKVGQQKELGFCLWFLISEQWCGTGHFQAPGWNCGQAQYIFQSFSYNKRFSSHISFPDSLNLVINTSRLRQTDLKWYFPLSLTQILGSLRQIPPKENLLVILLEYIEITA